MMYFFWVQYDVFVNLYKLVSEEIINNPKRLLVVTTINLQKPPLVIVKTHNTGKVQNDKYEYGRNL